MENSLFYIQQCFQTMPVWCKWEKRTEIDGHDRVGAYVLSVLGEAPAQGKGILSEAVVYIGETHTASRNLMKRWSEFERVALGNAKNHSGARAFRYNSLSLNNTWLLAFPVSNEHDHVGASVLAQLFERELIWHYYNKYGRLPICNKK